MLLLQHYRRLFLHKGTAGSQCITQTQITHQFLLHERAVRCQLIHLGRGSFELKTAQKVGPSWGAGAIPH